MRAIKLELVRHGPPHNQLLSPLTPYLALCENHPPVTLHVPFEHNQFLYRLRDLYARREEGAQTTPREFQLAEMGRTIGTLLGQIPGLIAEVSRAEPSNGGEGIHLRLILSSSELALLPFELALSPEGLPGAGQPLVLQSDVPICITREVRRSHHHALGHGPWRPTRILFAWACPPGLAEVPHQAHLLALRQAVAPWCRTDARGQHEVPITVLPQASIEDIEAACESGDYTHVHVLAHGLQTQVGFDHRYALALHDACEPQGAADRVQGERLALALRAGGNTADGEVRRPVAVTLASCYGGAQGSVAGAGASIAHALHVEGVPIVVATQFPLGFRASVRLVEVLYEALLWGEDPREALSHLRRHLYAELPSSHEWASVTAYLELEPDFDWRRPYYQLQSILTSQPLDDLLQDAGAPVDHSVQGLDRAEERLLSLWKRYFQDDQAPRQDILLPYWLDQVAELHYALAIVIELRAQSLRSADDRPMLQHLLSRWATCLAQSIAANAEQPRRLVKLLWARAMLHQDGGVDTEQEAAEDPADLWASAHRLLMDRCRYGLPRRRLGAEADLLMLHLARLAHPQRLTAHDRPAALEAVLVHARALRGGGTPPALLRDMVDVVQRYVGQVCLLQQLPADSPLCQARDQVLAALGRAGAVSGPVGPS